MPKSDKLISTAAAARRLGVSVRRVQQFIQAGRLPAEKVGRDWLIRESDAKMPPSLPMGRPLKPGPEPKKGKP